MPPLGEGRGSCYNEEHVMRLEDLKKWTGLNIPLAQIKLWLENGDGAVLLDTITRDMLQISVGNLKPKQEAIFHIRLIQEIKSTGTGNSLDLPLTTFPRHTQQDADPVQADMINPVFTRQIPYGMELFVAYEKHSINGFDSSTHKKWNDVEPWAGLDKDKYTAKKMKHRGKE
jgi:hypothetical protein